jgi:tetratricopeptide (TPR) repeat protein
MTLEARAAAGTGGVLRHPAHGGLSEMTAPTDEHGDDPREALERSIEGRDLEGAQAALARLRATTTDLGDLAVLQQRVDALPAELRREGLDAATRFLRAGRARRALEELETIRAIAPDDPELIELTNEAQAAILALDARGRVRPLVERARRASLEGRRDEALRFAEEAVRLAPDDARALRLRDELVARQVRSPRTPDLGERPAAEGASAPELDPRPQQAERLDRLAADARRYLEAGRFQAALALILQLERLDAAHAAIEDLRSRAEAARRDSEVRVGAVRDALGEGRDALRGGDFARAIECFGAVLEREPGHPDARRGLAQARAGQAQRDRIVTLLDAARAHLERDDVDAARRDVAQALRLDPEDADGLALAEEVFGRAREAAPTGPPEPATLSPMGPRPSTALLPEPPAPPGRAAPTPPEQAGASVPAPAEPAPPVVSPEATRAAAARALQEGRPDRALELLASLQGVIPAAELERLMAQARRAQDARELGRRVVDLLARARILARDGAGREALALAEQAVIAAPDDARALRLRDELRDRLDQR